MTDQDPLTTLERLLNEATPGPWIAVQRPSIGVNCDDHYGICTKDATVASLMDEYPGNEGPNAHLIAHLRNLAPALVEVAKAAKEWETHPNEWTENRLHAALRALEVTK